MSGMNICGGYTGVRCVDGSCPVANRDEYAERGYDIIRNCSECCYYEGCRGCIFSGTDLCEKNEKDGPGNGMG